MRVLVCGGRDYARFPGLKYQLDREHPIWVKFEKEYKFVMRTLDLLAREFSKEYDPNDNWLPFDITIIEGGAKGADMAANDWAVTSFAKFETYQADWDKYGKSAGYRRNAEMLEKGKPDLVVAFPGGKGTAMMVDLARKAGVEVRTYE